MSSSGTRNNLVSSGLACSRMWASRPRLAVCEQPRAAVPYQMEVSRLFPYGFKYKPKQPSIVHLLSSSRTAIILIRAALAWHRFLLQYGFEYKSSDD
jgi:hypothetical protein